MTFAETIHDTMYRYQLYLDEGHEPIHVPYSRPKHLDNLVHASSLFDCPVKAYKERIKAKPVFEELAKRNNPTLLHRMLQGTRMAEPFQEAFLWDEDNYNTVLTEESVFSYELKLQGRMDLFVIDKNGKKHIVEFKHRLPQWKTPFPQPRAGDIFQLLGYKMMTDADYMHLVIINIPMYRDYFDPNKGFEVWDLVEDNYHDTVADGYTLISEHGIEWVNQYNDGDQLNEATLKAEVERQISYMSPEIKDPPIRLGGEGDWQCISKIKKSKNGEPGRIRAMCPYFCHTDNPTIEMNYVPNSHDGFYMILQDNNDGW